MLSLRFPGSPPFPSYFSRHHDDEQRIQYVTDAVEDAGRVRAGEMEADHFFLHVEHGGAAVAARGVPGAEYLVAEANPALAPAELLIVQGRAVINVLNNADGVVRGPAGLLDLHVPLNHPADSLRHAAPP